MWLEGPKAILPDGVNNAIIARCFHPLASRRMLSVLRGHLLKRRANICNKWKSRKSVCGIGIMHRDTIDAPPALPVAQQAREQLTGSMPKGRRWLREA